MTTCSTGANIHVRTRRSQRQSIPINFITFILLCTSLISFLRYAIINLDRTLYTLRTFLDNYGLYTNKGTIYLTIWQLFISDSVFDITFFSMGQVMVDWYGDGGEGHCNISKCQHAVLKEILWTFGGPVFLFTF